MALFCHTNPGADAREAGVEQADDRLKRELILKEEALLENSVRNDARRIAALIQEGCIEISSSGRQRIYQTGELFENLEGELYIVSNSVRLMSLGEDCKLLQYSAGMVTKNSRVKSIRSSIWQRIDGQWKMRFHQGTNCTD